MSSWLRMLLLAMLALPALGQQPTEQKATNAPTAITVEGVLSMVQAGLSDDVIIARLHKENHPFDLSTDDMIRLKQAKVSDAVLKAMLDPNMAPTQAPSTVLLNPGLPGAFRPSGATPIPGGNEPGDLNDPMVPHDSGIYLYTKGRDGKPEMIVLERASYQGAKTGGMFSSAMTYGIAKAKTKAQIPGPHAVIQTKETSPIFYFYFDDKPAGLGKTYFGTNSLSNPNQFALLKLQVNKKDRETVIGKYSIWGSSSGADAGNTIPFKSERIRAGLYKVELSGMKPGEYCFFASAGGVTAAGPIAVTTITSSDLFDFGVAIE